MYNFNSSFIDKITNQILSDFKESIEKLTVVLPSKRAKVFLIEELKSKLEKPIFSPNIISIEDFIQDIAQIRSVDSIEILFEFYQVYLKMTEIEKVQDFESFSFWAKMALQDFNEIDRYLLDTNQVFHYLKEIEVLKRWDLEPKDKTNLIESTLEFWNKLPLYYSNLINHLQQKGIGYQGMIYREAEANLKLYCTQIEKDEHIIFAGFNALNQAEEKIFQYLLLEQKASVYWDIDYSILQDPFHDAGMFIRKYKQNWKSYTHSNFNWIENHLDQSKKIHIIGTPKSIGQAKTVGNLIEQYQRENENLRKTAIVLGEENLLLPILYNLPESVDALNITMGYSSKNNPIQLLVAKIFKLHINALNRNPKQYVFYYKEVLDIITHPIIESFLFVQETVEIIKRNNFTYFSKDKLFELFNEQNNPVALDLIHLIFDNATENTLDFLQRILKLLLYIKTKLSNEKEEEKVLKAFLFSIYSVVQRITSYIENYQSINTLNGLFALYKQIVSEAEVSFEGEPLTGLQIMGVLESRVLDFETVIITSVNEGKFPAGKSQNSFIPYDVKRELGLPTFKEKDAIYSYHFYHLLFRSKNIYILYNTESEGIDAGEKSRFITQLEIEYPNLIVENTVYSAHLPTKAYHPMVIEKSDLLLERLKEIATVSGFSPSSLTSYIRNPMQFYMQRVLKINEQEEVEENIAINTLGTIIHEALEELYLPYCKTFLAVHHIEAMEQLIDEVVLAQFKKVYREGEITKGKNLLAFEVAKQNVVQLLSQDKEAINNNESINIQLLEAALSCTIHHPNLPYPITISGKVDRIELRNGKIRIIDYKSGKVEATNLKINDFIDLTKDIKNEKIIQLLCYALMFQENEEYKNYEVEAGIISFKNRKAGFMPFGLGKGRGVVSKTTIDTEILNSFKEELVLLIHDILNQKIPFEEKN